MFGFDPQNPFGSLKQPGQFVQLPQQGGMFGGKRNIGEMVATALSGYLAGTGSPGGQQMLQMLNERRQRQTEHQQSLDDYNRKRADDQADWKTEYDYKLANPSQGDSEYERLLAASGYTPGSPDYLKHVQAKVNQMENPIVMTPYGPMPYSAVNPTGPKVGDIVDDPRLQGGPTPQASGGFPGY